MKSPTLVLGLSLLAALGADAQTRNAPLPGAPLREAVKSRVEGAYPGLDALYKELHAHPELSLNEANSSRRVAAELKALGADVATGVGGHGVVGVFRNGNGPTVLIRADMDALPVKEQTGLPYASKVRVKNSDGNDVDVMHACGHDVHMSVLVGTAKVLSGLTNRWHGTVVMIGQPAEERGLGAKAMLSEGLYKKFPRPDYALALHVSATLPAGKVSWVEGYALANSDKMDVLIRGVGGHGAFPNAAKDPVVLAAQAVLALQTIVSRETPPTEAAVVTVGSINGGTKHNIIPDEVRLQLTLRSYSDEVREHSIAAVKRIVNGLALAAGMPTNRMPIVTVGDEFTPSTYNNPELARRLGGAFQGWLGAENTAPGKPVMGAEDFGLFGRTAEKIPICIWWLGAVDPEVFRQSEKTGNPLPSLHSPLFAPVPETTIKTGVTSMVAALFELLAAR